jgi:hypothetical protein
MAGVAVGSRWRGGGGVLGLQTKAVCSLPSFSPQRGGGMDGVM